MTPSSELLKRLDEIEARIKKGTKGTWYAHPYTGQVRTGFMRWLDVREVDPQYQKHVATMEDETWAIATALNEAPWLVSEIRTQLAVNQKRDEVLQWASCILTALNVGDIQRESKLHQKLREVLIEYRADLAKIEGVE